MDVRCVLGNLCLCFMTISGLIEGDGDCTINANGTGRDQEAIALTKAWDSMSYVPFGTIYIGKNQSDRHVTGESFVQKIFELCTRMKTVKLQKYRDLVHLKSSYISIHWCCWRTACKRRWCLCHKIWKLVGLWYTIFDWRWRSVLNAFSSWTRKLSEWAVGECVIREHWTGDWGGW